jgi:hypothetical protein
MLFEGSTYPYPVDMFRMTNRGNREIETGLKNLTASLMRMAGMAKMTKKMKETHKIFKGILLT